MYKKLNLSITNKYICSRLLCFNKPKKYYFSTKQNFETGNHYLFIKSSSTIKDLNYKEEILEYFAYNYSSLKQSELHSILNKLKRFKILAPEIKEIKCFLRDFVEISENIKDEELICEFINFFIVKMDEIDENMKHNKINTQIENNIFDLDFSSLINSFFFFLENTFPNARNPKLFDAFFKCLNRFPSDNLEKSNEIWNKLIEAYYTNEEIHLKKTDVFNTCCNLGFVLKAYSENGIKETKWIKYMFNNFSVKFFELIEYVEKDEKKNFIPKEHLEDFKILYYYMHNIFTQNGSLKNNLKNELRLLSDELKDIIFESEDEIRKFMKFYEEKLKEEEINKEENIAE